MVSKRIYWILILGIALQAYPLSAFANDLQRHEASLSNERIVQDTIAPPWDQIELTGTKMKPHLLAMIPARKSLSPWYFIGGGIIAAGTATLLILDRETSSEINAHNDVYNLPCGMPATLNVLVNDSGEDLRITDVSSSNSNAVIQNGSIIYLEELNQPNINLQYEITDASGNIANAEVTITVNFPEILAVNDNYEVQTGSAVSGNLLDNDTEEEGVIDQFTNPSGGTLQLANNGEFTFLPENGFTGESSFQYTLRDKCDQTSTATVTIIVGDTICDFDAETSSTPAHCGLPDGTATLTIEPDGNYTILWNDGSTERNRTDLPAGNYQVEVIDSNACLQSYTIEVEELSASYLTETSSQPGNCLESGEIVVDWDNPGQGPMILRVSFNGETSQFELSEQGPLLLSTLMNVPPGLYTLELYDNNAGPDCKEIIEITVEDRTAVLSAVNDTFSTPFETPLNANVINNDSGFDPFLMQIDNASNGTLEFDSSGAILFSPEADFSGTLNFTYIIQDACGQRDTAEIIIQVGGPDCDLTANVEIIDASCGLSDGSILVTIEPAGNYAFNWSNGANGNLLDEVATGVYHLTVEEVDKMCEQVFEWLVGEKEPSYILDTTVIQGLCGAQADIILDLFSEAGPPFLIDVTYAEGIEQFLQNTNGLFTLSDKINVVPGSYRFTIRNLNLPSRCAQEIVLNLQSTPAPEIIIEAVIPPSSPTADDGEIILVVEPMTVPPYSVYVNGELYTITSQQPIRIQNLEAGDYLIYVEDANGCASNMLEVILSPDNMLRFYSLGSPVSRHFTNSIFRDVGADQRNITQGVGMEHLKRVGNFQRYLQFSSLLPQYPIFNEQIFTLGYGWERSLRMQNLELIPRVGANTFISFAEEQTLISLINNISISAELVIQFQISKEWKLIQRSGLNIFSEYIDIGVCWMDLFR